MSGNHHEQSALKTEFTIERVETHLPLPAASLQFHLN